MSRTAARVSGSERGPGPGYSRPHRLPPALHSDGKLRLRSTPRAFWRRPSAKPSGLSCETTQRSTAGDERARMRVTAVPAHSSPWMQPTTSARVGLPDVARADGRDRRAPDRSPDSYLPLRVGADADVHVVVVVDQRLDLPPRPAKPDPRADEHLHGAGLHESSHEVLREDAFDLGRAARPSAPGRRAAGSRRRRRARSGARRGRARRSVRRRRRRAAATGRRSRRGSPRDERQRTRRARGAACAGGDRFPSAATAGSAIASRPGPK